jgi:hypothetical protein
MQGVASDFTGLRLAAFMLARVARSCRTGFLFQGVVSRQGDIGQSSSAVLVCKLSFADVALHLLVQTCCTAYSVHCHAMHHTCW